MSPPTLPAAPHIAEAHVLGALRAVNCAMLAKAPFAVVGALDDKPRDDVESALALRSAALAVLGALAADVARELRVVLAVRVVLGVRALVPLKAGGVAARTLLEARAPPRSHAGLPFSSSRSTDGGTSPE